MAFPRFTAALVATALMIPAAALAEIHRYVAIDSAELRNDDSINDVMSLVIAGRLEDGTERTGTYQLQYDRQDARKHLEYCHRLAVLVLSKPGKYRLDVETRASSTSGLRGCKLVAQQ